MAKTSAFLPQVQLRWTAAQETRMTQEKSIVFGTGPLGFGVAQIIAGRGGPVTLVNRRGKIAGELPDGIEVAACDATDATAVYQICKNAGAVFHCAMPPYTQWPEKFPPVTRGILEGVARTGARLIYGDNLYMYGDTGGRPISENLPHAATGPKGRVRAEMAALLLKAHETGKLAVAIGRGADFYGPRVINAALGEMFFGTVLSGKPANLVGNIDLPHTYTYIRDFARALVTLSENDRAFGQAWHVPSAPTISTRQLVKLAEAETGRPIKVRAAGKLMVSLLGLLNPMVREIKEMMYQWEQPYMVDHRKFEQAFGADPTPHETAIRETVAWYRRRTGLK
jgi:nucleoside-diphosphate-sugar epimerase